ncbi:hypothetical protein EJO68_11290 [Variovorax atrisoli]|nr:hypothetical protein EJO68_11290 [Variovorax sp. 369]
MWKAPSRHKQHLSQSLRRSLRLRRPNRRSRRSPRAPSQSSPSRRRRSPWLPCPRRPPWRKASRSRSPPSVSKRSSRQKSPDGQAFQLMRRQPCAACAGFSSVHGAIASSLNMCSPAKSTNARTFGDS